MARHESTDSPFDRSFEWSGPSSDPNDEQFGDIIESISLDHSAEYDAVLIGEPYDGAVIGRQGASAGPNAIRSALAGVKTHHFDAGPVGNVGDLGSVRFLTAEGDSSDDEELAGSQPDEPSDHQQRAAGTTETTVSAVQDRLVELTTAIHDRPPIPIFLGGDNSLTYPNLVPLLNRDGRVGAINLDAHLDCRAVQEEPSSGTPYRQLLEAGLDELVVVGARHFETSTAYAEYLRNEGGQIVTAEEVDDDPVEAATIALDGMDVDYLYVSVDIDALDAVVAPGVSAPTPGGITARELFRLVRLLVSSPDLAGFEVVETAPPLCPDGRTADVAARTVAHALSTLRGEAHD